MFRRNCVIMMYISIGNFTLGDVVYHLSNNSFRMIIERNGNESNSYLIFTTNFCLTSTQQKIPYRRPFENTIWNSSFLNKNRKFESPCINNV